MKANNVWPRQPCIGLALAAVVGILLADYFPSFPAGLIALLIFAALALVRQSSLATYLFVAAGFFSAHAARVIDSSGSRLAHELGDAPQAVTVAGFVITEPKVSVRGISSFLLRATSMERDGLTRPCRATLSARWQGAVSYGDEVRIFGVASPVAGPRNPGEFDMRRYLARHDVRTALISRYPQNGRVLRHTGGNPFLRAAHSSRAKMDAALGRGIEDSLDQHSLISGIVLGLRDETPDEIEEQFQQTGPIHLFATAGLHVGIVAYLLWTMARVLRLPRKVAICLIVPGLFFYAAITGWNIASVRAATMAAVVLGGAFLDRRVVAGNSLAAAALLLLCVNTQELFSMGFQLSFAVVGTIIWMADPVFKFLLRWFQPDPFLPAALFSPLTRFRLTSWRFVARGASVSLAAAEDFLREQGVDLRSDILIKGQHHSGISGTPEFLDALQPQLIIASSVAFPDSELVKDDWAQSVSSRGIKLLRQDETGAVRLRFFKDHWEAKPYLRAETFRSTRR